MLRINKNIGAQDYGILHAAHNARWLLMILTVIGLDQLTKWWAQTTLLPYTPKAILPIFDLTLAYNKGAAFSFLNDAGGWQQLFFGSLAIVVSVCVIIWLLRLPTKGHRILACALSLISGGALGNLIDRVCRGQVVDFIDLHIKHYHWPVFNIADSAIFVGAVFLIVDMLWNKQ